MSLLPKQGFIEKFAENMGVIPKLDNEDSKIEPIKDPGDLSNYPPPEKWDNWVEYEATKWSRKKERHYTECFANIVMGIQVEEMGQLTATAVDNNGDN